MVTFKEAVRLFFTRYTDFKGRSRRSEYWWVQLMHVIIVFALALPLGVLSGIDPDFRNPVVAGLAILIGCALALYVLAIIIPGLALSVRRMHDINQTGWLVLGLAIVSAIPVIGLLASIAQVVMACLPGTAGPNKYGEDPKRPASVLSGVFA